MISIDQIVRSGLCITLLLPLMSANPQRIHTFTDPIDAVSFAVPSDAIDMHLSFHNGRQWSPYQALEVETEFDPLLRETNLVLFPEAISQFRLKGATQELAVHPIRIDSSPVSYELASTRSLGRPRILSRRQWGANDSLLYEGRKSTRSDVNAAVENGQKSERVIECERLQKDHPGDFRTARTEDADTRGRSLRWPRRYSPEVDVLVVHHTAIPVRGDGRRPIERMRALYEYHAKNRGWGDIGYHFVIDEEGQIYEGRNGGRYVVGGHVYCANVGSIGIALMGNFESEKPTPQQVRSLKWLMTDLADVYDINLQRSVSYHGKRMDPIQGHSGLISTACPGYFLRETLSQIRSQVRRGDIESYVRFPVSRRTTESVSRRSTTRSRTVPTLHTRVAAVGNTTLIARPGGFAHITLQVHAGQPLSRGAKLAPIVRSNKRIGIWQERAGQYVRLRDSLTLPTAVTSGQTELIKLRLQLPSAAGDYSVDIGSITYILKVQGRRARTSNAEPSRQSFSRSERENVQTPGVRRVSGRLSSGLTSRRRTAFGIENTRRSSQLIASDDSLIRVRLSYVGQSATLQSDRGFVINGQSSAQKTLTLRRSGNRCAIMQPRTESSRIAIQPVSGITEIASWQTIFNRFRGTLECRIIDGEMVFINELPLEQYLWGLGEEPDTEPPEKQKAFAVAARSYAAFYLSPLHRKFPGKPYDASDSPAAFQLYSGVAFEERNPRWVEAAKQTQGQVLKVGDAVVKAAYFSSDDGRTRSPAENGWNGFPFAHVFASKPDPWCQGMPLRGHGVGMSGCGSEGQANEGRGYREILEYYYPGTEIEVLQ